MTDDPSPTRPAGLVAGFFLLSAAAAAYEIAPASVTPLVRQSLGIGPGTAGWIISVMYAASVVTSVPVGVALDRVNVRGAVVTAGVALLAAGAWGYYAALAGAIGWLLVSRVLGGIAYVVVWNAGANAVGATVPPGVRATAVGVFTASAPAGFALGQFGAPLVATRWGWPAVFPAFASLAGVGVVVFLWATPGGIAVEAATPTRGEFAGVFRNRAVWMLSGLCFLGFSLYLFLNSWLPSYLTEVVGVSLALGGGLTALFPAVGIAARSGGGPVSDRLFDGRRRPVVLGAFAVAAPAVAGIAVLGRVTAIVALVVVAGLAVQATIGLLFTYVGEVVDEAVRATAIATMTAVGLSGAFLAPIGAGAVIEAAGYRTAFLLGGVVGVVGVALAWRAPATRRAAGENGGTGAGRGQPGE